MATNWRVGQTAPQVTRQRKPPAGNWHSPKNLTNQEGAASSFRTEGEEGGESFLDRSDTDARVSRQDRLPPLNFARCGGMIPTSILARLQMTGHREVAGGRDRTMMDGAHLERGHEHKGGGPLNRVPAH
ncbi:hypothetical protein Bbelb_139630 [Branchiostoma belcheri]|nr:hypothetical protein Bbelb_139630 [Branchiostoma belcheri]